MIVTVANRKGGVGKTTTAIFLAHALARATGAPCTVIDLDPQASAAQWAQHAAEDGRPLDVTVVAQRSVRLGITAAPNVVIDTPPTEYHAVEGAMDVADLVLVPTSPSSLDLSRVQATLDAARRCRTRSAVLLTRTRRTLSLGTAEQSLRRAGVRVLDTHIPLREAVAMAFGRPLQQLHGYDLATAELLGALPDQPYSLEAVRRRAIADGWARLESVPARFGQHRWSAPPEPERHAPSGPEDDIIERLKTSVARLATR